MGSFMTDIIDVEVIEKKKKNAFRIGPHSVLTLSVKTNCQVLISCRNNKKLLCRVKAFDRHMDMILENIKEMWTQYSHSSESQSCTKPINKDRFISKMFLRGDSVILVLRNPK